MGKWKVESEMYQAPPWTLSSNCRYPVSDCRLHNHTITRGNEICYVGAAPQKLILYLPRAGRDQER
jgi:hypothetical protein